MFGLSQKTEFECERVKEALTNAIHFNEPSTLLHAEDASEYLRVRLHGVLISTHLIHWCVKSHLTGSGFGRRAVVGDKVVLMPALGVLGNRCVIPLGTLLSVESRNFEQNVETVLVAVFESQPKPSERALMERSGVNIHVLV